MHLFWLAECGANPVGGTSAQVDELWKSRYRDATGFFGMFEADGVAGARSEQRPHFCLLPDLR